jgi:hypothetical protein
VNIQAVIDQLWSYTGGGESSKPRDPKGGNNKVNLEILLQLLDLKAVDLARGRQGAEIQIIALCNHGNMEDSEQHSMVTDN